MYAENSCMRLHNSNFVERNARNCMYPKKQNLAKTEQLKKYCLGCVKDKLSWNNTDWKMVLFPDEKTQFEWF